MTQETLPLQKRVLNGIPEEWQRYAANNIVRTVSLIKNNFIGREYSLIRVDAA